MTFNYISMNAAFYQGALSVSEVDCKKKKTAFPFWHLIIEKLPRARCVPLHCQNGFLKTGMKKKKKTNETTSAGTISGAGARGVRLGCRLYVKNSRALLFLFDRGYAQRFSFHVGPRFALPRDAPGR